MQYNSEGLDNGYEQFDGEVDHWLVGHRVDEEKWVEVSVRVGNRRCLMNWWKFVKQFDEDKDNGFGCDSGPIPDIQGIDSTCN